MSVTDEGTWIRSEPGGVGALAAWTALDGRPRVASSGTDGSIQIWDPESAEPVGSPLLGDTQLVLNLSAWAWRGGRLLVSASEDGSVYAWDVSSDEPAGSRLDGHRGWVQAMCFWDTPAGPRLATAGQDDGTVRLWDPVAGTELGPPLITGRSHLAALASWPAADGDLLAVGFTDGRIEIWDLDGRRRLDRPTSRHEGGLWSLCAWTDPTGAARLASSGPDNRIRLWDPATGSAAGEPLAGHSGWVPILTTCPQPGGTALISAAADGTVRIWDVSAPEPAGRLIEGTGGALPSAAVWTSTGGSPRVAVAQRTGVCSYDIGTGQAVGEPLVGHVAGMWALTSWREPDGTHLAVGGDTGTVQVWNADTGQTVGRPLTGHTAAVWQVVHYRDAAGRSMLASTGDDGTVRLWDPLAGTAVATLLGHRDWVPALVAWTTPAGAPMLISAGIDGTIRRWDPLAAAAIGAPLTGHEGRVLALAVWEGPAGPRLASGGDDGTIRIWDPVTGEPVAEPWTGHDGWVRSLSAWQGTGPHLLVSGGYDGTVRLWDLDTGVPVHEPLRAHADRVGAVWTWAEADGGARLVTAGADGVIRRWDLDQVAALEPALRGHEAGVWAVTGWTDAQGEVRVATTGQDGTVRLWDPRHARAVRTLEIGPVSIWGVSDAPTRRDVIGRQALAEAVAQQIRHPGSGPAGDGPTVVGIEGPWGCGKSTLMNLVRELLRGQQPVPAVPEGRGLTVRAALRHIAEPAPGARPQPLDARNGGVVTAWFNPWAYQSGEQIWAGLASEIIDAVDGVLYTTTADRQAYWLRRNLGQVDRFALRRALRRRTRSPIFGLSAAAFLVPAVVTLLGVGEPVSLAGAPVGATWLAAGVAVTTMLAGIAHTLWRRRLGLASAYLPPAMLDGPAMDVPRLDAPAGAEPEPDPLRRARSGALYLYQHHVADLIDDLTEAGHQLVVFVDDIDRCRPGTVAEVFEAINVFLADVVSRSGLRAQFVVGLDSGVVAGHLDQMYRDHADPAAVHHGEDPSPGWAFLRKLIQLPVLVPQVSDQGLARLVDSVTGQGAPPPRPAVPVQRAAAREPAPPVATAPAHRPVSRPVRVAHTRVQTLTWRSAERHPQVRGLLLERLSAQPVRSIRETKRLINVWQLYARLMEGLEPLAQPEALIARARHLLILAEIVTRWPSLQRGLHRHVGGTRGLRLLAEAAADEQAWQGAVHGLGLDGSAGLTGLRELLIEHDGVAVADLADQVL